MTIDEAIAHCLEVAERQEYLSHQNYGYCEEKRNVEAREQCAECAADYRQFAEWLMELKELREQNFILKSTLSAALKDINGKNILEVMTVCKLCAMKFQQLCDVFPWQYANEALKLVGDENDAE